jgi:gliding motility-associated-like protein
MFRYLYIVLLLIFFKDVTSQCLSYSTDVGLNCTNGYVTYSITVTNGTGPYSFTYSPNVPNTTFGNVSVSTFSAPLTGVNVLMSDINNCGNLAQLNVTGGTFNSLMLVSTTSPFTQSITCFGANNGALSLTVTGTGIQAPFSYSVNGVSLPSNTITSLPPGTYSITGQDSKGCTRTNTYTIAEPGDINSSTTTSISCFGSTTTAVISTTGGIAPYSYTVNGNAITGNTITNLSAGTYTLLTKDVNNCTKTNIITVSQPPAPLFNFNITQPTCPTSSNGALSVSISNMNSPFSYTWSAPTNTNASLSNIPKGIYTLTVKDAANCLTTRTVNVLPISNIQNTIAIKPETCSAADGGATISVTGGASPLNYSINTLPAQTASVFAGLSTGMHTLIVTDANTCSLVTTFSVGNTSMVTLAIISQTDVLCYNNCDGKLILNVNNAIAPITYSLTGLPSFNSNTITTICAGSYTIKATDAIGCYATTTATFSNPAPYSFSVSGTKNICVSKTATLNSFTSGGTAPYTYSWMPGSLNTPTVQVSPSSTTVYSLNVFDSKGCTLSSQLHTVTVAAPLTVSVSAQNAGICPGTTAQITPSVSGGDGNYTYLWLPGNITAPSIFISNISIPTYSFIVSDGCGSPTFTKVINLQVFPITVPSFSADTTYGCEPLCVQFKNTTPGSTNHIWNFGDKPYEQNMENPFYCYNSSGSYPVKLTLTDANGCKFNNTIPNYINVLAKPRPNFITRPEVLTDDMGEGTLLNSSANSNSVYWFINNNYYGNTSNINVTFKEADCFLVKLIATNNSGCYDSLLRNVCVKTGFNFYMPNTFSPNNNGVNDVLLPFGRSWLSENYSFKIFNRWGQLVFQTKTISEGWDGKSKGDLCPNDTYFYIVQITDFYDTHHEFKGHITLLR